MAGVTLQLRSNRSRQRQAVGLTLNPQGLVLNLALPRVRPRRMPVLLVVDWDECMGLGQQQDRIHRLSGHLRLDLDLIPP